MQQRRGPIALDARSDPANFGYRWVPWLNDTMADGNNVINSVNNVGQNEIEVKFLDNLAFNNTGVKTVASVIGCDRTTGFRNLLCLLRAVF